MPAAWMRTSTSSTPGSCRSTSSTCSTCGPPNSRNVTAFISAMSAATGERGRTSFIVVVGLEQAAHGLDLGALGGGRLSMKRRKALGRSHRRRRIARDRGGPFFRLGGDVIDHGIDEAPAPSLVGGNIAR